MKPKTLLNFAVFVSLLVLGYRLSTRFYHVGEGHASEPVISMSIYSLNSTQTLNNGQHSILFIGVDYLDISDPQLTSLWLVSYLPMDATLRVFPISPSGMESFSSFEKDVHSSFSLKDENGRLSVAQDFINLLQENNYWWSGYFVFDQVALTKMIDWLDNDQKNGGMNAGNLTTSELPGVEQEPQDSFSDLIGILQTTCLRLPGFTQNPDWSEVMSLVPTHILTDLDLQQYTREWMASLPSQVEPNCKFPTLEISRFSD